MDGKEKISLNLEDNKRKLFNGTAVYQIKQLLFLPMEVLVIWNKIIINIILAESWQNYD